jgi:nitrate/nitrite-specific signal transduction histidine kinase
MENLQLILVTVLITLVSGAVVGSIAYLVAVVRKLRRVVNNNTVDIKNLQNALNNEVQIIHNRFNEFDTSMSTVYTDLDRKIDSRCDKLFDGYNKEILRVNQELNKRDESIEHLRELLRQALSLKK